MPGEDAPRMMMRQDVAVADGGMEMSQAELVRVCARLSGDPNAAEDLAQETRVAAWRHQQELRDPGRQRQWLIGIARNVCANWRRRQGRELARRVATPATEETAPDGLELAADDVDLEAELERAELAQLLDRALALLPPSTRQVLLARYVQGSPQAETARRLGLSEGAVAMKLQRGKLAMRRVLATELREAALTYGLAGDPDGVWQATRLWCPLCGRQRLRGRFLGGHAGLELRCPECCRSAGAMVASVASAQAPELFRGVRGFRAAYGRLLAWDGARVGGDNHARRCPSCGAPIRLTERRSDGFAWWGRPSFRQSCTACTWRWDVALPGFLLALPAGRRFWRDHPRIRFAPVRAIERQGGPALVAALEDAAGAARLEIVCARDSLAVLHVNG